MKLFSLLDTQYKQFHDKVQGYLSKVLSSHNTSLGSNTIFGQIITVVGNAIQNVMLYIEDALVEQNKYTAQRKKSIYNLATLSGYSPSLGKASQVAVKLSFTPTNAGSYNVIINNKEQLTCTQNGLLYNLLMTQEAVVLSIDKDNSTKYFTAVQGVFEKQRFVSQGGQYYTVSFNYVGNIDTDYMTVKVNDEIWEYQASLYDMSPDGKEYTFKVGTDGSIVLIFGNEAHGRSLKSGDTIEVEYLLHDGSRGNINPHIDTYFTFNKLLNDTDGDTHDGNILFNVKFAEKDPITAGSNSENIVHVANMIGLNSRSLVLASPDNYKLLISRLGFCGYNRTWADSNSAVINSLIIKNYKADLASSSDYFDLDEKDFILTDNQKSSIYNYIEKSGNQLASVKYNIIDPDICKYVMYIYIKLKSSKYNKDLIKSQIKPLIGDFFTNIESDIFIPKSDIIQLLKNNVEGIDGIDIYILSQKNEEAILNGKYTEEVYELNNLTGQYVKRTNSVKLYDGENPNLGLDDHGNILLKSDSQFPVLMANWDYKNINGERITVTEPLTIVFED